MVACYVGVDILISYYWWPKDRGACWFLTIVWCLSGVYVMWMFMMGVRRNGRLPDADASEQIANSMWDNYDPEIVNETQDGTTNTTFAQDLWEPYPKQNPGSRTVMVVGLPEGFDKTDSAQVATLAAKTVDAHGPGWELDHITAGDRLAVFRRAEPHNAEIRQPAPHGATCSPPTCGA